MTKKQNKKLIKANNYSTENSFVILLSILLFFPPFFRGLFFEYEFMYALIISSIFFLVASWVLIQERTASFLYYPLDYSVIGLLVAYLVSSIVAIHSKYATLEVLKMINYFIVYWLVSNLVTSRRQLEWIILALFSAGVGTALAGLGTAFGTFNFNSAWVGNRIFSTMQYPNTLAIYLTAAMFLGSYLWYSLAVQNKLKYLLLKFYILAGLFLINLTILGTQSRGAWLLYPVIILIFLIILPGINKIKLTLLMILTVVTPLVFSSSIYSNAISGSGYIAWLFTFTGIITTIIIERLFYLGFSRFGLNANLNKNIQGNSRKFIFYVASLALLLAVFSFVFTNQSSLEVVKKIIPEQFQHRLERISLGESSVLERLLFYQDAFDMIKERPILGYGGGGWEAGYWSFQKSLYFTSEVHSHFLKVFVETGILGFIMFVSIWVSFGYTTLKIYMEGQEVEKVLAASIFASVLAIAIHSVIDFNLSLGSVAIFLFALLGCQQVLANVQGTKLIVFIKPRKQMILTSSVKKAFFLILSALIIVIAISSLSAMNYVLKAIEALDNQNYTEAGEYFTKSIKRDPWNPDYLTDLAQIYYEVGSVNNDDQLIELALIFSKQSINKNKLNSSNYFRHSKYLLGSGRLREGNEYIKKALELAPMHYESYFTAAQGYYALGEHYLMEQDEEKATHYFEEVINTLKKMELTWESIPEDRKTLWKGNKLEHTTASRIILAKSIILNPESTDLDLMEAEQYLDIDAEVFPEVLLWKALIFGRTNNADDKEKILEKIAQNEKLMSDYNMWAQYFK